MKFEFELTKNDYKKELELNQLKTTLFYLVAFTIIYFVINIEAIKDNLLVIIISYIVYMVILFIIMFLINKVFVYMNLKVNNEVLDYLFGKHYIEVTDKYIKETFNKLEETIYFDEIKKIKYKKDKVVMYTNRKITYSKKLIGEKKFNEFVNVLKERTKK